ncbi:MAG: hypothetical protein GX640_24510, partial [Fibrobacter sp.]|nr:hypothetical protein [Fibrobacter sp.]
GGSVEEIFYVLIQGTSKDTVSLGKKTSWSITFGKKGTSRVIVFAVDNEKNRSVPDTITFDVKSEKPQFTLDKVDTTMTIKDTMYIHASLDYNYGVTYVWDRDNDGIFEDTTGSKNSITLYYDTTGTYIIRAQCLSELGDTAISAMVFTITVTEGRPFVKSISVSDTTYPGKKFTINVSAYDNKGISEYLFSLDSGSFLSTETSSIDTFFTTIGKHFIHIKVKDNIGLFSDVLTDSIIVAHGEPSIQNFKASVTTTLVKEDVTFSFIPFDPDGEVKKVYFNWNGGTTVQDSLLISYKPDSTFTFIKKFTVAESGTRKVRIWAVDNENQKSLPPEEIEISVLKGDPVIKNVTPGEVWVKRDTMITIHASDTNGSIVMTWVDWNNDGKWDDSSDVAKVFPHKWDTLSGDKFSAFTIKVKDDDQLTATKVCSVFVKMGRPVVRGGENYGNTNIQWKNGNDGLDTMFFVWNAGQVTAVAVDTADPNGYCKEYYWNWYKLGLINNTTSVPYLTKEGLTINDTNRVTVTCIDNDSIYSKPYSFFVFPDAPPPEPVVYTGSRDGDSVTVKWVKSMDDKDKGNTKVQILIGYGITSEPSTALFSEPLPTVDSFELDPNDNTLIQYKFKADSNGAGRFKVKLIDARGSSATSTDRGSF